VKYCSSCVYPSISAVALSFDDQGMCSGCRASRQKQQTDWQARRVSFRTLLDEYRSKDKSNYDCIIPVSGGKDSYYQTHVITKEFGLRPLLVTYHGNNYTSEGLYNLDRMRDVFNADHIIFRPGIDILKKLNLAAFHKMGDMNWHAHVGIYTYPAIVAVKYQIPLIIWGEHGRTEVGGMYSLDDFVEMTSKYVREHAARGYSLDDFVGASTGLDEQDMLWLRYPSDDELFNLGIRGIHLNNFVEWKPNDHAKLMIDLYGWHPAQKPFDRTYRLISNLDDMHENGAHDYLKFIKFGYGRCTDHACKDIRAGIISRAEGVELVKQYDSVRPSDLDRWFGYVGISETEWNMVCDTFRDPRVWWIENGEWNKYNLWGGYSAYGTVTNEAVYKKFQSLGRVKA
jgi:N-acetyl sugar amidotransferase